MSPRSKARTRPHPPKAGRRPRCATGAWLQFFVAGPSVSVIRDRGMIVDRQSLFTDHYSPFH
jgi:hypothetical protein